MELYVAELNEILAAAKRLGGMIGSHPAVSTYREVTRQLELDIGARNLLGQFEQLMEMLAMKEANMQPIEIAEKQQVQQLQQSIAIHPLLKRLMQSQQEYMEVMKKVQESINGGLAGQPGAEATAEMEAEKPASKIILE